MPFIYCNSYRLDLLKLVCICAVSNNFTHVASVEIHEISFWKRKKKTNQHWYLLSSNEKDEQQLFFVFSQSLYEQNNQLTLEIRSKKKEMMLWHRISLTWYCRKQTSGTYWLLRRKQNVWRCWSLMWEKKSTKILSYHKPQVATFLHNDVEKWWILMLHENA